MHELSIAMSIVDMASEEAARRGVRVTAVHLKLGALYGVVSEALQSAYAIACETTPLEDSTLVIEEVPVVVFCPGCNASRPLATLQLFACEGWGTPTPEVVQGREPEVVALEIEA